MPKQTICTANRSAFAPNIFLIGVFKKEITATEKIQTTDPVILSFFLFLLALGLYANHRNFPFVLITSYHFQAVFSSGGLSACVPQKLTLLIKASFGK